MAEHADVKGDPRVYAALEACECEPAGLDERTWGQIEKVEAAVQEEVRLHREAKAEARRHMLSIDSVSKRSGVSRQTFYNKGGLLADYTQQRRKDEGIASDSEQVESLRRRLDEAEGKLDKMLGRDAQLVALYAENAKLKEQLKRYRELADGVPADLREEIEASGVVVPFPGR